MRKDINKTYSVIRVKGKKDELLKYTERIVNEKVSIIRISKEKNTADLVADFAEDNIILFYDKEKNEYVFSLKNNRLETLLIDLLEEMQLNAEHIFSIVQDNNTAKIQSVYENGFLMWNKIIEKNNMKICSQ